MRIFAFDASPHYFQNHLLSWNENYPGYKAIDVSAFIIYHHVVSWWNFQFTFHRFLWKWIYPAELLEILYFVRFVSFIKKLTIILFEIFRQFAKINCFLQRFHLFLSPISNVCILNSLLDQFFLFFCIVSYFWWIFEPPLEEGYLIYFSASINISQYSCILNMPRYLNYFVKNIYHMFVTNSNCVFHHLSDCFMPLINYHIYFWISRGQLISNQSLHQKNATRK